MISLTNSGAEKAEINFMSQKTPYKKYIVNEVTIHTLPHLKVITLVSVRSSHLPFKMH